MRDLLITVDHGSGDLTGQLTRALREAVRDGRLGAGVRLPATRTLATDLGVSRGVAVEAYAQLVAEGYLVSRHGSGTRVASGIAAPGSATPPAPPEPAIAYDLKPGTPDLAAFPRTAWLAATRRALAEAQHTHLGYGDPAGSPQLRAELASYLGRVRAAAVDPSEVMVVSGVSQSLALLTGVLAARGHRRLAVEDPSSPGALELLRAHGFEPVGVPVDDEGIVVAALAASGASVVLVSPAHQYPTGVVLSPARRAALVAWARDTGGVVLEDDYDAEFRYDREPVGCLQGLARDRVVHLGSLSKSLAPGLRLGWAVVPAWLTADFREAKRYADLGTGVLDQLAFAGLLADGAYDRHLRAVRARYRSRRDALVGALHRTLPTATVRGVAAGLHLYLDLPAGVPEAAVVSAAAARRLRVEPVAGMRLSPGGPALTLGYAGLPERRLVRAAELLAESVAASVGNQARGQVRSSASRSINRPSCQDPSGPRS
ncbi:PLP-dependent aminotransferase family protein [Kitasatospora atroaurantiaca]|uniref:GntR family transcriptional regulator/MocR family aminotransferase n=1 Tax=Kitasatospora atroaurantiaca TaxID=285545 RepID=A0A561EZ78_9ACTN|nr:PLP-dependent aminotransferase family protein [Kitasatospora atroaurantiaca]TWE20907.1 GntR family transcriptional regulator/MocR family aminotransferase [Kitasatospora atroaurantiaca]